MAKGSGSKKKLLMIVGLVALVGGVGFGGFMMGKGKGGAPKTGQGLNEEIAAEASGETQEPEKSEGGHGGGHGKEEAKAGHGKSEEGKEDAEKGPVSKKSLTFNFSEFVINLFDPSARTYLKTTIRLEASSPEAYKRIEENEYPLREATIMLFSGKTKDDVITAEGKERIKRELLVRYEGKLGPKAINELYLGDCNIIKQ